jgi:hypothetical protein
MSESMLETAQFIVARTGRRQFVATALRQCARGSLA